MSGGVLRIEVCYHGVLSEIIKNCIAFLGPRTGCGENDHSPDKGYNQFPAERPSFLGRPEFVLCANIIM